MGRPLSIKVSKPLVQSWPRLRLKPKACPGQWKMSENGKNCMAFSTHSFTTIFLFVGMSQFYWAWRGIRLPPHGLHRAAAVRRCTASVLAAYLLMYEFTFGVWREHGTPVHLTIRDALLAAPFLWWMASSLVAFLVVILFAIPRAIVGGVHGLLPGGFAGPDIQSPPRRQFLERTARGGGRRAFRGRSLWPVLRTAQPRDHGADHPLAAPAARLRGISHLPALRYPHRPVHARRGDPEIRRRSPTPRRPI